MESRKRPCGLLVRIEKDALGYRHERADYMIGYFDRLTIRPIHSWLHFMPGPPNSKNFNQETDRPVSFYPIKLLFPESEAIQKLEESGFDYTSWSDDNYSFFDDYPCITIVIINLTDRFKGKVPRDVLGSQLERFAKIITQGTFFLHGAKKSLQEEDMKAAHFCILPSLGYSDYCLLFAEKSWVLAPAVMDFLHTACDNDNPVLSTDYIMPVYHAGSTDNTGEPCPVVFDNSNNNISMSVRVNLRPGASMSKLKSDLAGIAEIYHVTGTGDCIINPYNTEALGEMIRLLMPNHARGNEILRDIFMDTETLLQWPVLDVGRTNGADTKESQTNQARILPQSDIAQSAIDNLREVLKEYESLLRLEQRQMRQLNAIHEHITSLENICGEGHNASLQHIMAQWLPAFSTCLRICVEKLRKQYTEDAEDAEDDELLDWLDVEKALDLFNNQVGSFMADLSRSDNFFMESERYNHTSVSSATALITAYNRWQNMFSNSVMKHANIGRAEYAFLVRSGGCDETTTYKPFWFLPPSEEDGNIIEYVPFVIQMSEIGLFDCSGTVFRMTHECMHFCGNRKRDQRLNYIIKFASRYYGRIIEKLIFRGGAEAIVIESLVNDYGLEDASILDKIRECSKQCSEDLIGKITNCIEERLEAKKKCCSEKSLMIAKVEKWLCQELCELFSCYELRMESGIHYTDFTEELYREQLLATKAFYAACDGILQSQAETEHISFCKLECRKAERLIQRGISDPDEVLISWITGTMRQIGAYPSSYRQNSVSEDINRCCVEVIVPELIIESYSETFADLEACMRLDASISDYILGFAFENKNLQETLPMTSVSIIRIASILQVWYPNYLEKGCLNNRAEQSVRDAILGWELHGFPRETLNAESIVDWINQFLQVYEKYRWVAEPLEEYLELCRDDYLNNAEDQAEMKPYRDAFHSIRLSADRTDEDFAGKMFTALTQIREVK